MSDVRLEKLLERIRFLRDRQRFFEGVGLAVLGLLGVAMGIVDLRSRAMLVALGFIIAFLASLGYLAIEKELRSLWDEVMKRDPRSYWISVPIIALIGSAILLVATVLQLLGIVP